VGVRFVQRKRNVVVNDRSHRIVHPPRQAAKWRDESALLAELERACAEDRFEGVLVDVIVPVLSRPHRVAPLLGSFRAATEAGDARINFIAQRSDVAELEAIRAEGLEPILVDDCDRSWAKKINRGYEATSAPWILLGADDLSFHRGWVDVVRHQLRSHRGVIGTNDLGNRHTIEGTYSTHPLVRRLYARICGTVDERNKVVHEGYDHNFPDTELVITARNRGLYLHRTDCVIEHLHPFWGKSTNDPVYARGQAHVREDQALFVARGRRFGW
jgi:hypothetical protein